MNKYLAGLLVVALAGCRGYQHTASPHFTPVFNKENKEVVATIGTSYYHLGYSISKKIFLFNSGFHRSASDNNIFRSANKEGSGGITRTEASYELNGGAGYFIRNDRTQFILMFGGGAGKVNSRYEKDLTRNYVSSLNADKYNFFIQPNVNFLFPANTTISLSSKLTCLTFAAISSRVSTGDINKVYTEDETFINKKSVSVFFIEPGFTYRVGGPRVKFEFQMIAPIQLGNPDIRYKHFRTSIGLALNLF